MQVFKAYFKIIHKNMGQMMVYVVVFISLALMFTFTSTGQKAGNFTETKTNFAVINRGEDSPITRGLTEFLQQKGNLQELEDTTESIQDALFFRRVEYVAVIPEMFVQSFLSGEQVSLEVVTVPDSTSSYYLNLLTDKYLNTARMYGQGNPQMTPEEIVRAVRQDLEIDTQVELLGESRQIDQNLGMLSYYSYLAYILIAILVLGMSSIMMVFNKPDLRRRNLCSPIPLRSVNAQLVLASGVFSLVCWGLVVIASVILYGSQLTDFRLLLFCGLNALVFTIVGMSIGFLVGILIKSANAQSAISNVLSLGMSFLAGVFVPQEFLGSAVLTVASFTPTYWYIKANNTLAGLTSFQWDSLSPIFVDMSVQLGFAVAILAVALMISKQKQVGNN